MSLVGKNRKIFSYNNQERRNRNFQYKDFEKTKSYRTDFGKAKFICVSFRAAQLKYCNFNGATFEGTEFVGTNLRGSSFKGATFKDAIFNGVVMDGTNFKGATFDNCLFIGNKILGVGGIDVDDKNIRIVTVKPSVSDFSNELINIVQELRMNDIIRRSHTLHGKKGGVNTVYIQELLKIYSEQELCKLLLLIPEHITTQFYTLSYLKVLLKKAKQSASL